MPEEHEVIFNGCKYRCYLKTIPGNTRPYFRVFCGRKDPKCKVPLHLPAVITEKALPKYVPSKAKVESKLKKEAQLYQQMLEYRLESVITASAKPLTNRVKKRGREWTVTDLESPGNTLPNVIFSTKTKAMEFAERNAVAVIERLNDEIATMKKLRAGKSITSEDVGYDKYVQMVGDFLGKPKRVINDAIKEMGWNRADLPDWAMLTPVKVKPGKKALKRMVESAEKIAQMQAELKRQAMKGRAYKPATDTEVKLVRMEQSYKLPYERYVMAVRKDEGSFPMSAATKSMHQQDIERALSEGKTVPQKVLDEYPGVQAIPEPDRPYYRMTFNKFVNVYELQVGDPVLVQARAFALDKSPEFPKGVDGLAIVEATITGFTTGIIGGEPLVKLRAGKIIAGPYSKGYPKPKGAIVNALKGRSGTYSVNEVSYGEVHKKFIRQAQKEGKTIPAKVLAEYPNL